MDPNNNLQMIHEQEGEFAVTQDMDGQGPTAGGGETQVR